MSIAVGDITRILQDLHAGDAGAANRLYEVVYQELRQIAMAKMARESASQTLQPTALVHEAWLRLGGEVQTPWRNRAHFFGAAAEAMRRILIDHARKRQTVRRGGGQKPMNLDEIEVGFAPEDDGRIFAANEALEKFALADPEKAELVKLRFWVGLTIPEAAETLGISEPTANRWWAFARAWLMREVEGRSRPA